MGFTGLGLVGGLELSLVSSELLRSSNAETVLHQSRRLLEGQSLRLRVCEAKRVET